MLLGEGHGKASWQKRKLSFKSYFPFEECLFSLAVIAYYEGFLGIID